MCKLESTFFLFLENVWTNHELFGRCLDIQKLLATDARGLG